MLYMSNIFTYVLYIYIFIIIFIYYIYIFLFISIYIYLYIIFIYLYLHLYTYIFSCIESCAQFLWMGFLEVSFWQLYRNHQKKVTKKSLSWTLLLHVFHGPWFIMIYSKVWPVKLWASTNTLKFFSFCIYIEPRLFLKFTRILRNFTSWVKLLNLI